MNDLPEMTVQEHHELCIGTLACCFSKVDDPLLWAAIYQACKSAQAMGMKIDPEALLTGEPLSTDVRMFNE